MQEIGVRLIITTCKESQAEKMADCLLKERLVACVNIVGPVKSKYRWEGKIEAENECMLFMKTRDELVRLAKKKIEEIHSYQVPEIISLEVEEVNPQYLDWVKKVTRLIFFAMICFSGIFTNLLTQEGVAGFNLCYLNG